MIPCNASVRVAAAILLSTLGAVMFLYALDMGWRGVIALFGIAIFIGAQIALARLLS